MTTLVDLAAPLLVDIMAALPGGDIANLRGACQKTVSAYSYAAEKGTAARTGLGVAYWEEGDKKPFPIRIGKEYEGSPKAPALVQALMSSRVDAWLWEFAPKRVELLHDSNPVQFVCAEVLSSWSRAGALTVPAARGPGKTTATLGSIVVTVEVEEAQPVTAKGDKFHELPQMGFVALPGAKLTVENGMGNVKVETGSMEGMPTLTLVAPDTWASDTSVDAPEMKVEPSSAPKQAAAMAFMIKTMIEHSTLELEKMLEIAVDNSNLTIAEHCAELFGRFAQQRVLNDALEANDTKLIKWGMAALGTADAFPAHTQVIYATVHDHFDAVNLLLDQYPQVFVQRHKYSRGWNAVHYAARLGSPKMMELLTKKEPVEGLTRAGETLAHLAAMDDKNVEAKMTFLVGLRGKEIMQVKDGNDKLPHETCSQRDEIQAILKRLSE